MFSIAKLMGSRRDNQSATPQPAAMRRRLLVRVILAVFAMFAATAAHATCDGLKAYSTTAASNNATPPCGWPASNIMQPGQVDDSARQNMADTRAWYDDAQWINPGYPVRYISGTAFEVSTTNPSIYHVARRIKVDDGSGNLTYGTIVSVTDLSPTANGNSRTVIVAPDSGSVASGLANVWYGAVGAISSSIVSATLGLDVLSQPFQLVSGTTKVVTNPTGISMTVNNVPMLNITTAGTTLSGTLGVTGAATLGSIGTGAINMSGALSGATSISTSGGAPIYAGQVSASTLTATTGLTLAGTTLTAFPISTCVESAELALNTGVMNISTTHTLGAVPKFTQLVLRNKTTELNWAVGEEAAFNSYQATVSGNVWASATKYGFSFTTTPSLPDKNSPGSYTGITVGNWRGVLRACL